MNLNKQSPSDKKLEGKKKQRVRKLTDAYLGYIKLSKTLFANDDCVYDINELPADSEFIGGAKKLSKQLGIKWDKMTHEESNRIMLALLEDYYRNMAKAASSKNITLCVKFKIEDEDKPAEKQAV